jgi:hypothetical protein
LGDRGLPPAPVCLKMIIVQEKSPIFQRRKCSLMKKEETPHIVPKYPDFLAAWTKFETFYF